MSLAQTSKRTLLAALALGMVANVAVSLPAKADDGRWRDHGGYASNERHEEREWREREWREREWREHEWRARQWHRVHHEAPRVIYAPPPVVYAPMPSPGINFIIPLDFR